MTMLTVMFNILLFGVGFVLVGSLLLVIPIIIYIAPYTFWVGSQNCVGRYKHLKNEKLWSSCKNATKFYLSFITGKEPMF